MPELTATAARAAVARAGGRCRVPRLAASGRPGTGSRPRCRSSARSEVAAVVAPRIAPHHGSARAQAAAGVAESRLGGGSLYFRSMPGNIRYVSDFPTATIVVAKERYERSDEGEVPLDELAAELTAAGDRVIYTPEAVCVAEPASLFRPHLRADVRVRASPSARLAAPRAAHAEGDDTAPAPRCLFPRRFARRARRRGAARGRLADRRGGIPRRALGERRRCGPSVPLGLCRPAHARRPGRDASRLRGGIRRRAREAPMRILILNWRDLRSPRRGGAELLHARGRAAARRARTRGDLVHVASRGPARARKSSTAFGSCGREPS